MPVRSRNLARQVYPSWQSSRKIPKHYDSYDEDAIPSESAHKSFNNTGTIHPPRGTKVMLDRDDDVSSSEDDGVEFNGVSMELSDDDEAQHNTAKRPPPISNVPPESAAKKSRPSIASDRPRSVSSSGSKDTASGNLGIAASTSSSFPRPVSPELGNGSNVDQSDAIVARRTWINDPTPTPAQKSNHVTEHRRRKLGVDGKTLVTEVDQDKQLRNLQTLFIDSSDDDLPTDEVIDAITSFGMFFFILYYQNSLQTSREYLE